jgi:3-oxoadipate enol-lactonase
MPKTFINGIDLHYNIYGSGAPIILVHGLGMDQGMWDLQAPEFSRNYQVIIYDLRGHGQSESPDYSYSIDLFADDLHHFLRYLGLKKSAALGLSLGGRIVLRFALKYPEETRALLLADAQSETPEESKQRFRELVEVVRRQGMGPAAEVFFSWPLLQRFAQLNPERFQKEKARFAKSSAVGFIHSCLAIAQMEPLTDRLGEIKAPTLALAGEKDEPFLPYLDIYSRRIPNCKKLTIPRAGHLSNIENPQAFNQAVLSFLSGLANP